MRVNFDNPGSYYNRSIFNSSSIRDLIKEIEDIKISSKPGTKPKRILTEAEVARIPEIFASVPLDTDILNINPSDTFISPEGRKVTGALVSALIELIYRFSRGEYAKIIQTSNRLYSAGTPLALYGYKNYHNIPYNRFRLDKSLFEVNTDKMVITLKDPKDIEKVFRLDLYLGKALASTTLDLQTGNVSLSSTYGLAMLCADLDFLTPTASVIQEYRQASVGNYKCNILTGYGAVRIPPNLLDLEENENSKCYMELYNNCSTTLKHMLMQRWIYNDPASHPSLISYWKDWDKPMASVESAGGVYKFENINNIFGVK